MIALFIFLGILLLLTLVLLFPLRLSVRYADDLFITVNYLFFKFQLLPAPAKPAPAKKKGPKKPNNKPTTPESSLLDKLRILFQEKGAVAVLSLVRQVVILLTGSFKSLVRHLRVKQLDVYFCAAGEDASQAAILYGEACAVLYPLAQFSREWGRCKEPAITVDLLYSQSMPTALAEAKLQILPLFLLREAAGLLKKGIPLVRELK